MKHQIKLAFYVSGRASRLVKLLQSSSIVLKDTVLVVNDNAPNKRLSQLLSAKGIIYIEFNYKDMGLQGKERNIYISNLLLDKFRYYGVKYCFCFGRMILKGALLTKYKNRIINFHPSILPLFPGERSIDQAMDKRVFLLGNTAQFINEGTDTGPVIMQSILHRTRYIYYESVLKMQLPMIEQIYKWLISKRISVIGHKVFIKSAQYGHETYYPCIE